MPSSPTPHLHRTLQAPNAVETISIRETLLHSKPQLSLLDDEISQVREVLVELRRKRKVLHKFTVEHSAFLAPIRRLPPEILTYTFALCLPKYKKLCFDSDQAPTLIGQVCAGWRQIALSTQYLWSSMTVTCPASPNESLVKTWLSRATSSPLSIRLNAENHDLPAVKRMRPAIAQLVQYCDRWKHLEIRLPPTIIPRLDLIRHRLPWLESLRIQTWNHFPPQRLDLFDYAPRLHNLRLDLGISPSRVTVPWNQLTQLDVYFPNVTVCLETLQQAPNLVKCIMHCSRWINEHVSTLSHDMPVLRFPHLTSLYISGERPREVFNHFELPTLRDLHVEYELGTLGGSWLSQQPFISLLSRSSHTLRKLTVHGLFQLNSGSDLAHCLQVTPSLNHLNLQGSGCWFTPELLISLTRGLSTNADACLVPQLEVLEICDTIISGTSLWFFADMIESRWKIIGGGDAVARLKSARFVVTNLDLDFNVFHFDDELRRRLNKFREEGMDFSIIDCNKNDLLGTRDYLSILLG